jgi:hypothetical protein
MSVGKIQMLDGLVSTHCKFTHSFRELDCFSSLGKFVYNYETLQLRKRGTKFTSKHYRTRSSKKQLLYYKPVTYAGSVSSYIHGDNPTALTTSRLLHLIFSAICDAYFIFIKNQILHYKFDRIF